jgi:hypothetical protein
MASSRNGGSEYSLSSLAGHDECFCSLHHAETSLNRMEAYLLNNQLTDITLIAGMTLMFIMQEISNNPSLLEGLKVRARIANLKQNCL